MNNPITLLTLCAVTGTALAIGGLSTMARADSLLEPRSVLVHFEDLDATSTRGAELLYNRIKLAAETVCSDLTPQRSLALSARYASCVQDALGEAIMKINRPLVTEYAMARGVVPSEAPIKVKVARAPGQRTLF
jgi:UrcA family protein